MGTSRLAIRRAGCLLVHAMLCAAIGLATQAEPARAQTGVDLELFAGGISRPTSITHAGDGSGRLFITQQDGTIVIHDGAQVLPQPFLDITALVSCCGERGLLSVAFHPDYAGNGLFYVDYTDLAGDTVIARYSVSADPDIANPGADLVVLSVPQPAGNHNGGQLQFGPDGFLYIALGDGGTAPGPGNPAQDLGEHLGKILRVDVDGGTPFAVPPDNPFVGVPGARPAIWAYGLRNPWRFSFDRQTGDLFIADVGQNELEEVDIQPALSPGGENYGWSLMEGSQCFDPPAGCNDGSLTLPAIEYDHATGACSITGGYRYRGARFPQLRGLYLYGDFCSGQIWGARPDGTGAWTASELLDSALAISSFGEDEAGELYVAGQNFANPGNGALYRIVPTFPVCDLELSQPSYVTGETVTAQSFRLANPGPEAVSVEIKAWFAFPTTEPVSVINIGADGSLSLPAGLDLDLGPLPLLPVDAGLPRGAYELDCRMVDPVTGGSMILDTNPFSVL